MSGYLSTPLAYFHDVWHERHSTSGHTHVSLHVFLVTALYSRRVGFIEGVDWIKLAQDGNRCQAPLIEAVKAQVS
jgi:hypothetical protein